MTKQLLAATLTATALFTFAMSKITGAETDRTRIYFIGNSLTDEVKYKDFVKLAKDGGEEVIWGRHMIPGCPIRGLWGAKGGFQKPPFGHWQKALRDFEWDVVTMQPFCPFPGEYEHALLFAKETIKKSPEALICIYAQWPHINQGPDWDQAFTRPTRQSKGANSAKMPDFSYNHVVDTAVPPELRERYRENSLRNDYEVIVYGLRANLKSKKPAVLIPAGHAMQLLGQKMQAGLVPGYRTPWDFYSDGCHVNNDASYLVACAFYATIFGKSPVGLPVGGYQGKPGFRDDGVHISPEMARIIQETVWEVVATHPLTGVTSDEPFKIASPILAPAVGGEPYLYELIPAFGKAPYKWSLAAGALPEGITLSSGGTLSGVPAKPGKSEATFQVTDAKGATTRKRLDLSVAEDTAPTIPEQKIPAQSVGKFFEYQLKSQGGNGAHKWSVKDDESIFGSQTLPFGLSLDPNGRLSGSPGKEGTCTFQLVVADGDSGNPETAERTFTLEVGPPDGEIATARRLDKEVKLCAWNEEPDPSPWKFRYPIKKLVQGDKATVSGAFDIAWDDEHLWVAVKVKDLTNTPGSRGDSFGGDNTVLCLDALNNREATYNADDRYLAFARNCPWPTGAYIGSQFSGGCRWKELDDGYFALYQVSFNVIGLKDPAGLPNRVIGLDVVLVDDAKDGVPKSMVVWQGTKDNRTDPSKFGSVVLSEADNAE